MLEPSCFVHTIPMGDYTAFYNSLYLAPIFLNDYERQQVESYFKDYEGTTIDHKLLTTLEKNKIIVNPEEESKVIEKLTNIQQPEAYVAFFIISEDCNLRCKYCFIDDCYKEKIVKTMTSDMALKCLHYYANVIKNNKKDNENFIMIYGGEPLTNPIALKTLVSSITSFKREGLLPENVQVNITTNGTLLNEEWIIFFRDNDVSITVSLDGDKDCNKERVYADGHECYEDVIANCKLIKKHGLKLYLSITLSNSAIEHKQSILSVIDELKIDGCGFNPLIPRKYPVTDQYLHNVAQFITETYIELRKRNIDESRLGPKIKAFKENRIYMYDCAVTSGSQLTFLPDGIIGSCHALVNYPDFNLCTVSDDFEVAKPILKKWCYRTPVNTKGCMDCIALGLCGGTCPAISIDNGKSYMEMDEQTCVINKKIVEWIIKESFKYSV